MRVLFLRVVLAGLAVSTIGLGAAGAQSDSDDAAQAERELEDWERDELETLVEVVGEALEGERVLTEKPFELVPSFIKGTDGNTYVPFTLTIDASKLIESTAVLYVYVNDVQDPSIEEDDSEPLPPVFEDAYFVELDRGDGETVTLSRAFSVPGGDYEIYVAVRDSLGEDGDDDDVNILVLNEVLSVPDLWVPELQTSSVLIAESIETLSAPLTPQEQIANPYTLGAMKILPKNDRSFAKQGELSLIMMVYNPRLTSGSMPDVTVEYTFHSQTEDGEEYFNQTSPQQFNAQSLPPGFSVELGHQIVAGQAVPLNLFPAGEYRLEIVVLDNEAGTSLTRSIDFTVRES